MILGWRLDVSIHLKWTLHNDWGAGNTVEKLTVRDRLNMSYAEIQTYSPLAWFWALRWTQSTWWNPDTHGENMQSPERKQLAWWADSEPWETPSYEAAVITYDQVQIMFMEINGEKANPKWTYIIVDMWKFYFLMWKFLFKLNKDNHLGKCPAHVWYHLVFHMLKYWITREKTLHIHPLIYWQGLSGADLLIRSNLGFSILLKDASTCSRRIQVRRTSVVPSTDQPAELQPPCNASTTF